ncbi:MAG TPA: YgiQ family radical SAM protein [Oceanospirillales bacterium]|nr:YgiQ family radical SAM protein [Oceanospirillales bacterium]|tara:strand:- start:3629 stop:6004 length:2376 start_codon:yes stop_codon:yes gene_type:complete
MLTVTQAPELFSYPRYWAECYGTAPFLPMSRAEMDELGWDSCDIIIVCGDAYVDHPSFGMAIMGRLLESQGFRVGLICQPDWNDLEAFKALGKPNLYFAVSAGNMDSLINKYTADLKVRNDDAYTPHGVSGKRPDRAVIVYSQKCKQAYKDVPLMIGGIEASLRRIAQYDYWSDEIRRSVLIDSGADILLYGNAERAIVEVSHELASGKTMKELQHIRGTAVIRNATPEGWTEIDSTRIDWPGRLDEIPNPYEMKDTKNQTCATNNDCDAEEGMDEHESVVKIVPMPLHRKLDIDHSKAVIRLPSFEKVRADSALYAHASRILHLESNPQNAHPLIQRHGDKEIWVNQPPIPLETEEMDAVFALPYQRIAHPSYGDAKIPAYDMIRFSVNIMRGCFGGCSFCSITEHEGRVIQSRSQESVLKEIEDIRDHAPGFTGAISDLGGPTANMYHLNCKDPKIHASCRRLSCVFPSICTNLVTDHSQTTSLYRRARALPGIKRVAIASGLRYDLAVEDPEYVRELVTHHVGGYLKIAPEHTEKDTLDMMMKPGMGTYDKFKRMFEKYSKEAGKKQYLIPYFIAAHPGCEDKDMLGLALWLKRNKYRVDQVQTFYPSPMSLATAMYHSGRNPLQRVSYKSKKMVVHTELKSRRIQKAFLRYHDPKSWPMLREALKDMGREDMIGSGKGALIPKEEPEAHRYARMKQKGLSDRGRPGAKSGIKKAGSKTTGAEAKSGQGKPASTRPSGKSFGKPGSKPANKLSGKKPGKKLQKSVAEKAGVKQEGAKKSGKPSFKKRK